jgi:hypothetical protein
MIIDKQLLKLSKLCEHWATHNNSHKENYIKWRNIANEKGLNSVVDKLNRAIEFMDRSTEFLLATKQELEE